ncbi:MAG: hypothetical protein QXV52_08650 [Nitrososphaeria archaeon]
MGKIVSYQSKGDLYKLEIFRSLKFENGILKPDITPLVRLTRKKHTGFWAVNGKFTLLLDKEDLIALKDKTSVILTDVIIEVIDEVDRGVLIYGRLGEIDESLVDKNIVVFPGSSFIVNILREAVEQKLISTTGWKHFYKENDKFKTIAFELYWKDDINNLLENEAFKNIVSKYVKQKIDIKVGSKPSLVSGNIKRKK